MILDTINALSLLLLIAAQVVRFKILRASKAGDPDRDTKVFFNINGLGMIGILISYYGQTRMGWRWMELPFSICFLAAAVVPFVVYIIYPRFRKG